MRRALAHPITWVIGFALCAGGGVLASTSGPGGVAISCFGVILCVASDIAKGK